MRRFVTILGIALFLPCVAFAQAPTLSDELSAAVENCIAKAEPGTPRAEVISCAGSERIAVYQRWDWPFMDLVYEYEAITLRIASDADVGKISQAEYSAQIRAANLDYRAKTDRRFSTEIAAEKDRAERSLQDAIESLPRPQQRSFPAYQPYMLPPPLTFKPLSNGTNCTTTYAGNQAQTHCQ